MTLQETINKYKLYGLTDSQIIEAYFIENKIEDKGVELLNSLCQKQIKFLHEKNAYFKEDLEYCKSVLYNTNLPEKDKIRLFGLVSKFTYYKELDENELQEVKQMFEKYEIHACPIYFIIYLHNKGILNIDREIYPYQEEMLNEVIKRRGEDI